MLTQVTAGVYPNRWETNSFTTGDEFSIIMSSVHDMFACLQHCHSMQVPLSKHLYMPLLHSFIDGNLPIKQMCLVQQALTHSLHNGVLTVQACEQAHQPAYM